jgi:beta-ketodecanoyl-[acyl-carrier-protein] synthase
MERIAISGTGLYTPPGRISNAELVASFNEFVRRHNEAHAQEIAAGRSAALQPSSAEFIENASGIRSRYVVDRGGILDPEILALRLPARSNEEPSLLCEMALAAAHEALEQAGRTAQEIDCVIVACSNLERAYPAIAIELQQRLGCSGFAFDMNVACSSATFAGHLAVDLLRGGGTRRVLVANPEVCSGHLCFRDRDSHFIFGDAATAVIYERLDEARPAAAWEVLGTRVATRFSNHIRNNFGFLGRSRPDSWGARDQLFVQEGRKVFREVVPWVAELIRGHLAELGHKPQDVHRFWLHQANLHMNRSILERLLGGEPAPALGPVILDEYANTSSAGSLIAFHKHRADLGPGSLGVLCSFGAGYSAGSLLLRHR